MIHVGSLVSLLVFFAVVLVVGLWAAWRKTRGTVDDKPHETLIVAKRDIGTLVGTFTLTAVWVGGGYIMGTAEAVFTKGLLWTQAPVAYSLSIAIAGLVFAGPMRSKQYLTMLDPFQHRYGSKLGALMYLPALVGEICWAACVLASLGAAVAVIVEVDFATAIVVSAFVALLYTFFGGQYSVCYTDVAQLAMILAGLVLCTPFVWHSRFFHSTALGTTMENGTATCNEFQNFSNSQPCNVPSWMNLRKNWLGKVEQWEIPRYLDEFFLLIFGGIPWQDYFLRVLAAKNIRNAQILSVVAGLNSFLAAIPVVLIGYVAIFTNWAAVGLGYQTAYENSQLIFPIVLQHLTPPVVALFGLGAVGGGVMSSTDSSILSTSSMFGHNVYHAIIRPTASQTEMVWVLRIGFVFTAILACLIAVLGRSIYALWAFSSDLVYVIIFPQLVIALFCPMVTSYGYLAGSTLGFVLRMLGGQRDMGLPIMLRYPFFDHLADKQIFPFKTFAMLVNFVTSFLATLFCRYLFTFRPGWDFLQIGTKVQERYTKGNNDALEITTKI